MLFTTYTCTLQTTVLDQAVAAFPATTNWWIKGDAVDLVAGLGESVKGKWSGDVDIGDGRLQEMFKEYQKRLQMIAKIGLKDRRETSMISGKNLHYLGMTWSFFFKVC